jgi:hypothetical protein
MPRRDTGFDIRALAIAVHPAAGNALKKAFLGPLCP